MRFASKIFTCPTLILLTATTAFTQIAPPTSGARLDIVGSVSGNNVNRSIYDSQIHSGTVRSVSNKGNCTALDAAVKTDAYVLQGGSATGCDPEGKFETTQGPGTATVSGTGYSFTIVSQYLSSHQVLCTSSNVSPQICTDPKTAGDTGFLTVTNNSGADFSGTITLNGTAVNPAAFETFPGEFCPNQAGFPRGQASVSLNPSALANGASATFALSPDSSACGGFNAVETLPITVGSTTTFPFGNDQLKITPKDSNPGDEVTFLPVPVPAGQFNNPGLTLTNSTVGNGQACITLADFSAAGNPMCVELQTGCVNGGGTCSDAETFLWTGEFDFNIDTNSLPNGVGGVHFLGHKAVTCPQTTYFEDILISYADPLVGGSTGTGGFGKTCFVNTYTPGATPIVNATAQVFIGWGSPVVPGENDINAGRSVPLIFQWFTPGTSSLESNLHWCPNPQINADGSVTCVGAILPSPGGTPFVAFFQAPISCTTQQISPGTLLAVPNSSNFQQNFPTVGTNQLNWQTLSSQAGTCVIVIVQDNAGRVVVPNSFFKFF